MKGRTELTVTRTSAIAHHILSPRLARAGALVGIWVIVGIVSAVQIYFLTTWGGGRPDFLALVSRQVRNALPWIAITLLVFGLARRLPLRSLGVLRWVALHAVVGVCTVVALNVVQTSVHWMIEGPVPGYASWGDAVVGGTLLWGQVALVVYGALVGIAWVLVERREARARTNAVATGPVASAVAVRVGSAVRYIAPSEIDWIEGAGDYARLHVQGETYLSSDRLSALEVRLAASGLARIHRSTIVNLERVTGYAPGSHGDYTVELRNGTRLKASRRHRAVLDLIKQRARSD